MTTLCPERKTNDSEAYTNFRPTLPVSYSAENSFFTIASSPPELGDVGLNV